MNRRDFLRSNVLAGTAGLALSHPFLMSRQLLADETPGNGKRLIFIFQRGGNDGINTVIPRGDSDYNRKNRPTLYIPKGDALDTGNGFAELHPALAPMMELYNGKSINGKAGAGNLAVLHRIGYSDQSRSHFDSQEFWEKGVPGKSDRKDGMFFRQLRETLDLRNPKNDFVAASISGSQLLGLRGPAAFPNFKAANKFRLPGDEAIAKKTLGAASTSPSDPQARGILGLYDDDPRMTRKRRYEDLVQNTGLTLGATLKKVQDAAEKRYDPANGATYPDGSFGDKLREAAMLIKRTDVKILGLNIGGWDTHADQGQANGSHGNLLGNVAEGFQALHLDLQNQWDDLIIVTMTEFGRTSKENGGKGTDHAEASVMFVAGGGVKGGVYNCDAKTWKTGDMFASEKRYLSRKTDFRAVFGEIFTKHFGDDQATLARVIPGYSTAAASKAQDFQPLGFLSAT
jgi:uncharacterized protein (DUF1501 family)